jgi:hypothetical protein
MITSTGLHDLNSVFIPRLGLPFLKKFYPNFLGQSMASRPHFLTTWPTSGPFLTQPFPIAFYYWEINVHIMEQYNSEKKEGFSPFKIYQLISFSLTSLPKLLFILSPAMDAFNDLSTAAAARKILPLKDMLPTKVMSCALVASTDLENDLDAAKEVIGGVGAPSVKMASRSANSPGRSDMVCCHSPPYDEGRSPPAHQCSPCTQGHGTHPAHALSPRLTIGKEHRSVMPTRPT